MDHLLILLPNQVAIIKKIYETRTNADYLIRGVLSRAIQLLDNDPMVDYINVSRGGSKDGFERRKSQKIKRLQQKIKKHQENITQSKQDLIDIEQQVYEDEIPIMQLPEIKSDEHHLLELRNELKEMTEKYQEINKQLTRIKDKGLVQNEDKEFEERFRAGLRMSDYDEESDYKQKYLIRIQHLKKIAIEQTERWWHEYHLLFSSLKIMHEREELPFNLKEKEFKIDIIRNFEI